MTGRMSKPSEQLPALLKALQCAGCGATSFTWNSANHSEHPFQSPSQLICLTCKFVGHAHDGYLDIMGEEKKQKLTPFQLLMEFRPIVAIYDTLWRPFGYFIASENSFTQDVVRILKLMGAQGQKIYLDLACGPGQFARQVARMAPDSIVIGCDISAPMLRKAVRLTQREGLKNVFYIRATATALPFRPEVFDGLICCGALQSIVPRELAMREIARVLKVKGDFLCQTTLGPRKPPLYVRAADEILKFSYFHLDDLRADLQNLQFDLVEEERYKINYIFRAEKMRSPRVETVLS